MASFLKDKIAPALFDFDKLFPKRIKGVPKEMSASPKFK